MQFRLLSNLYKVSLSRIATMSLALIASYVFSLGTVSAQTTTLQDPYLIAESYSASKGQGSAHPDFILPSIDSGDSIQLSKFRGKKVLLLHFASW